MQKSLLTPLFLIFGLHCGFLAADIAALNEGQEVKQILPQVTIPEQFSVRQRWFSWTNTFDIVNPKGNMGTLHRRFLSLTLEYDYYDNQNQLQANARMRFFSIGAKFDVTDRSGILIGTTEQKIFRFFPTFELFSAEGELLAIAKMNFWGSKYTLSDPATNEKIGEMTRPFIRFRDSWNVVLTNPAFFVLKKIDPRLFIVVMAYQTDMDFWAYQASHLNYNHQLMMIASLSSEDVILARSKVLRQVLEAYHPITIGHTPSEEDFIFVENYADEYLADRLSSLLIEEGQQLLEEEIRVWDVIANEYAVYQAESFLKGVECLLPLLDGDALTQEQKCALFYMIDTQLNRMGRN